MNSILLDDLNNIIESTNLDWNKFNNKKIFITGATGLIGSILVKAMLLKNEIDKYNIKLVLLVRNIKKAKEMFGDTNIEYVESNVETCPSIDNIDYIIHAASPTKSKFLSENPVETIDTAVLGTKRILEIAKENNVSSMVYLSSMEVYGVLESENITEENLGYIDLKSTRSSYPEGKRMSELYCYSYFKEYDLPVKIARLAQTFGAGISKEENRVYKVFADAILKKQNIILKSKGKTKVNFCYTIDAIIGILFLMINGDNGESYNLVSNKNNMTIFDSAKWLAKTYGEGKIQVIIDIPKENMGFAPDNKMILSNEKIKKLGWEPKYNLEQGYDRLLKYLKEENDEE